MRKVIALSSVLFLGLSLFAKGSNKVVKALECFGTAEEPGQPRDIAKLIRQADGTFKLSFAINATERDPKLKVLRESLNCEFSNENQRLFDCTVLSGRASIQSRITTIRQFHSNYGVIGTSSIAVIINGVGVAQDFPQGIQTLHFMFEENCKVF